MRPHLFVGRVSIWRKRLPFACIAIILSLNFKICHKEPVHNRKRIVGLFPLDLHLGLWYLRLTRLKQVDNHVIKIFLIPIVWRGVHLFVKPKKNHYFFFFKWHVMCVTYHVSCLISHRSIDWARIKFSPFQRLVIFLYFLLLLCFAKVFI